jgi:hypothetical protein
VRQQLDLAVVVSATAADEIGDTVVVVAIDDHPAVGGLQHDGDWGIVGHGLSWR